MALPAPVHIEVKSEVGQFYDESCLDEKVSTIDYPSLSHVEDIPVKIEIKEDGDQDIDTSSTICPNMENDETGDGVPVNIVLKEYSQEAFQTAEMLVHDIPTCNQDSKFGVLIPSRCTNGVDGQARKEGRSVLLQQSRKQPHEEDGRFKCDECKKSYTRLYALTVHKRTHSGKGLQTCSVCKKSFTAKHQLTVHMKSHERMERRESESGNFSCPMCSVTFRYKKYLLIHIIEHANDPNRHVLPATTRNYKCDKCPKTFYCESYLMEHLRMKHSVVKNMVYPCPGCDRTFDQSRAFKIHFAKAHPKLNSTSNNSSIPE